MYAILDFSGRQHKVSCGDVIHLLLVKYLKETITFDKVLFYNNVVGSPFLKNVVVEGKILKNQLGDKLTIYKYKRRKNSRVKKGYRQKYTMVRIEKIKEGPVGT